MDLRPIQSISGTKKTAQKITLVFSTCCLFLLAFCVKAPLGDFGNYYFGSLLYRQGWDPVLIYQDTHLFNVLIRHYEKSSFFLNYAPVPPFSLIAYTPFTFLNVYTAKLIFNLLSVSVASAGLYFWLTRQKKISFIHLLVLPGVFLPCYYNLYQGQTYLLICGILLLLYETLYRQQPVVSGFLLAFAIALKLSPVWFLLFFLVKKQFKALLYSFIFLTLLHLPLLLQGHLELARFYTFTIFPKLLSNEITDPLSLYNQSVHTFLLQIPELSVPVQHGCSALYYGLLILIYLTALSAATFQEGFVLSILFWGVINKYAPSYSLVLFFPVLFYQSRPTAKTPVLSILLLLLAIHLPVYKLTAFPLVLQYTRVWLLLTVFLIFTFPYLNGQIKRMVKWSPLLLGLVVWSAFNASALPDYPFPKKGFTKALKPTGSEWVQYICLGYKDSITHDTFQFRTIRRMPLNHPSRYNQYGYLVNDTFLFYLSDKGKGVGLPQLTVETIK